MKHLKVMIMPLYRPIIEFGKVGVEHVLTGYLATVHISFFSLFQMCVWNRTNGRVLNYV